MKDTLVYRNFIGSVHFSVDDGVFFGKIEGINDLVTFEGHSVDELVAAFHEAVRDYLTLCKKASKKPRRSYRGSFNIRTTSEIHRKAVELAAMEGISLNQLVQRALEKEVGNAH